MPWKTMDVQEQRVRFAVAASRRERPFVRLCEEFGISRPTGMLWVERYRQAGIAGLQERSRRPRSSPWQTAPELEEPVVELRHRYPDWGARKLQVLLRQRGVELTASIIRRILLRAGLVREAKGQAAARQRFERSRANELWQMDFKGPKLWPQTVRPLSVLDDHSRYLIVLQAVGNPRAGIFRSRSIFTCTSQVTCEYCPQVEWPPSSKPDRRTIRSERGTKWAEGHPRYSD
jgi:transposase